MKTLQEKVDEWKKENDFYNEKEKENQFQEWLKKQKNVVNIEEEREFFNYLQGDEKVYSIKKEREFFEWLQGCEYSGSEVEYNGQSGLYPDKVYYTITYEDGKEENFYL